MGSPTGAINLRLRRWLLAPSLAVAVSLALLVGVVRAATIVPVTGDSVGALALATSMIADATTLAGASFFEIPMVADPASTTGGTMPTAITHGTSDTLSSFPTQGPNFAIMTTGSVAIADDPNSGTGDGTALEIADNGAPRGDTDHDVSVLKVDVVVPATANCLRIDFRFFTEEFPEFVGAPFNDAFIAELDTTQWSTSGSTISAPGNFARDPSGDVISVNSTGVANMTAANAAGTTYDGATIGLSAAAPITPGPHSVFLSIFDQGDAIYDSAVFLDNLRFETVGNVLTDCVQGAQLAPAPTAAPTAAPTTGPAAAATAGASLLPNTASASGEPSMVAGVVLWSAIVSATAVGFLAARRRRSRAQV